MERKPYDHHYMKPVELNPNDIEALRLIAEGCTRKELASKMGIREKATDYRLTRICDRLGAINIPHAVALGITRGIIKVEDA